MENRLVYLLGFAGGMYKIGITKDLDTRLSQIGNQSRQHGYGSPVVIHTLTCGYYLASEWETFLHQAYKPYQIPRFELGWEYFHLPEHEVNMLCLLPTEIDFRPSHFYFVCLGIENSLLINRAAWMVMRNFNTPNYTPQRPVLTPLFVSRVKHLDSVRKQN